MGTSPFLGGTRWPGQGHKLPLGATSSDGDHGENRAAPFEQTQPAAGGGEFHPGTPAQHSTVILLQVEGSKMSGSTQETTTYYCRAQT